MPKRLLIIGLPLVLIALVAACDDGDDGNGEQPTASPIATVGEPPVTPTPMTPTETPSATATLTPDLDVHGADLASRSEVQDFVGMFGGEVADDRTVFADLTGDGIDEAVLPISSGGTLGDIALFVFGRVDGQIEQLLLARPRSPRSGISAEITGGRLVTTEEVFAPDDPLCCPSEIRRVTYRWDGSALVVADETIRPAS